MSKLRSNYKPILFIAAGIAFIALGVYRGEVLTVLHKAIVVCLECIGIG